MLIGLWPHLPYMLPYNRLNALRASSQAENAWPFLSSRFSSMGRSYLYIFRTMTDRQAHAFSLLQNQKDRRNVISVTFWTTTRKIGREHATSGVVPLTHGTSTTSTGATSNKFAPTAHTHQWEALYWPVGRPAPTLRPMWGSAATSPSTTVPTYSSACCNMVTNRCIDISCGDKYQQKWNKKVNN